MPSLTHITANATTASGTYSGSPIIEEAPGSCQHFKYWLSKPVQGRSIHNKKVMLGIGRHTAFSTARFPVNQYQQWLFIPSFLFSCNVHVEVFLCFRILLHLLCFCEVLILDLIQPLLLSLSPAPLLQYVLKTVKSSPRVGEAVMNQMKSACSLFAFPSHIIIWLY